MRPDRRLYLWAGSGLIRRAVLRQEQRLFRLSALKPAVDRPKLNVQVVVVDVAQGVIPGYRLANALSPDARRAEADLKPIYENGK